MNFSIPVNLNHSFVAHVIITYSSMSTSHLEPELRESLKRENISKVYFNKGL